MKTTTSSGMGICGWLTVLFVGLKLTGYITWSWWWVLAPLWGSVALVLAVFGLVALVAAIVAIGTFK